ncbi:MAG: rod shape-determining protein RodA [Chitinophagales bacterium]|nr:rod shape-determining protein RodA [Chitinophagales bacterium]
MSQYKKPYDPIDKTVLFCYILLVIIGILSVFATEYTGYNITESFFSMKHTYMKQVLWAGVSALMFITVLGLDRKLLQFLSYPIYGVMMFLLLLVFVIGSVTNGAQSWIDLGFFKLQPSEFAKFATAMALAKYFDNPSIKFRTLKEQLIPFAIIGFPLLMVLAQGDAGSAIVFLAFVFVLNREGLPDGIIYFGLYMILVSVLSLILNKFILMSLIIAFGAFFIYYFRKNKAGSRLFAAIMIGSIIYSFSVNYMFNNVLQKHQRDRINVILGQELSKEAKRGIAYNLNQSKIAIGSGGFFGKGYLNGTQTRYNYVPETNTDFIFSAIGEEWGFIGSIVLIGLYVTMLLQLLRIAERQRTPYGRVYIYSVVAIIFTHVTINLGMTIGLLPVIGIPLPFVSYGGSSLLSFSFMIATCLKLDSEARMVGR